MTARWTAVAAILCALALAGTAVLSGPARAELLFSDDFDGPAGSRPDPAHWGYDVGRWGEGAGELQSYTDRTENVRLDGNGALEIVARAEDHAGASYTSGRLQTRDKVSFEPPVRIEGRIQVPAGVGLLSGFWTLGTDLFTRGWPQSGEIDIVEVKGDAPREAQFHTHSPSPSGGDLGIGDLWRSPVSLAEGLHDYRIDWYDARIEFYVDGALRFVVSRAGMPLEAWAFSKPHYLTLNVTVGNPWTGPPDGTTRWPAVMRVDWVKAWRLA